MDLLASSSPPLPRHYKEVRGLSRGLDLLAALNATPGGSASTTELAQACLLDRTTTKRLLETLRGKGLVRAEAQDGRYALTLAVRRLSEGFEEQAWVTRAAAPLMRRAAGQLLWPVELGTVADAHIVIRQSTHRWSPLAPPGRPTDARRPLLGSAVGRAYLAACDDGERDGWLSRLPADTCAVSLVRLLEETRRTGHARQAVHGETVAVGVPVRAGGQLIAAMQLVFPPSSVPAPLLDARFVPALKALAEAIGKASRPFVED